MTKRLLMLMMLSAFFISLHSQGFLKAAGKQIVNEQGRNILLRGIGLGGWMLQEGYMLKLQGSNPQFSVRKRIEEMIGTEKTKEFYDAWLSNHTTKTDIDSLHAWGFNSVRLPMHYALYTLPVEEEKEAGKQTWLAKGFALTDSLLSWCKSNNMYLILDLHAAPGGQGNDINISDRDTTRPSLWQSDANKNKTVGLWKKLAERYKDEPNIGAYDLLNETNWGFDDPVHDKNGLNEQHNQPLRELLMKITEAIRSVDKKHIIIIEGNGWGNNYRGFFPVWDDNMVISFHKYWNNNDVKSIQHILDTREKYNVPVWLGETGENSNVWFADAVHLFEANNIGWAWWPLKKIGINNPLEIKSNPMYDHILNYWNRKDNKVPVANDVYNGLMELALNANINMNIVHRDVIDALFRQPFSDLAIPFKQNLISAKDSVIEAADYDLGRNGVAYFDQDTGNYYISGGKRSAGNKGSTYRNDGVDIYKDPSGNKNFYIGDIEDGEWIQYTIDVAEKGAYIIRINVAAKDNESNVSVYVDDKIKKENANLSSTSSLQNWQTETIGQFDFDKGKHVVKVYFNKGGFNFRQLMIVKQKH